MIITENLKFDLDIWKHYCFVTSADNLVAYINGEVVADMPIYKNEEVPLDGALVFGQEQDEIGGGFNEREALTGFIGQFNIWDEPLSNLEIEKMSNCAQVSNGNVFSTDVDDMTLFDATSMDVDISTFCSTNSSNHILFPTSLNFFDSERLCSRMNSYLYAPKSDESRDEFKDLIEQFKTSCMLGIFVGIEKVDDNWIYTDNGNEVTYDNFNNDTDLECVAASFSKYYWSPTRCIDVKCFSCKFDSNSRLFIKGLCFIDASDSLVFVKGYKNNKPYFHGIYGMFMFFEDSQWKLFNVVTNRTIATLFNNQNNFYPIGRHEWKIANEYCDFSKNDIKKIGLSTCKPDQFMCNDGECIPIEKRCDDLYNCFDRSDESNCNLLKIPEGYRQQFFPPPSENVNHLLIDVYFNVFRIISVDSINNAFTIEFFVHFLWKDSRLTYQNLKNQYQLNELSERENAKIWKPSIEFSNVNDGQIKSFNEKTYVEINGTMSPYDHNDVNMGKIFYFLKVCLQERDSWLPCKLNKSYSPLPCWSTS